ncbi:MAG: hypothetical protein COB90_06680 [Hyphomicrobiales bacterium]|nr:MAG: hypothetical protein COB90_06680 [Hyphomicrobiales bacterium]
MVIEKNENPEPTTEHDLDADLREVQAKLRRSIKRTGIYMAVGITLVISTIIYKTFIRENNTSANTQSSIYLNEIEVAAGGRITNIAIAGDRIIAVLDEPDRSVVLLLDSKTLDIRARTAFNRKK